MLTSSVAPRSLNEPVGMQPSSLKRTVPPPQGAVSSGVIPSPRVTAWATAATGSASR